ncbi:MAG: LamB/YcsF family protein [Armatimonadetes bacterium]|nr:LamB/YcsF family protein [Armatimonadota bacterium]
MRKVDLNVDIGEGFPYDEALLEFASSANVCCGEHAGSWDLTLETIELCRRKGVRIGMHPGFPDRESMGRRMPEEDELKNWNLSLLRQIARFLVTGAAQYVKPHGAWYNLLAMSEAELSASREQAVHARTVVLADVSGLPFVLLGASELVGALRMTGRKVIEEGFADRAYLPNGTLMPRSEPGAVLHDPKEIAAQVLRLAPEVDSICLHGDTPGCLEFAEMVHRTLEDSGYEVGY